MPDIIDKPGYRPPTSPDGASPNRLLGFDGITYFNQIDAKYTTYDTMSRQLHGAQTVHFDDKSGTLYYLETETNGPSLRPGVGFNLRTGEYISYQQEKQDPKKDPRILKALDLLNHRYDSWLVKPLGYPEVEEFTQRKMSQPPIKLTDLPSAISEDDYILFYGHLSHLHACKVSAIKPITDMPSIKGGYRVMTGKNEVSLEIHTYDHSSKQEIHDTNQVVDAIIPIESEFVLDKKRQGVWKISEQDYKMLMQYGEIKHDPSIEYPLSREEYVVACAFDGMAFDRWGASIEPIRKRSPDRYKDISKENLHRAVASLVSRFGEPALTNAVKWNALQHLYRLHTPNHRTKVVGAQNNAFGDVHSDILGFKRDISQLTRELTENSHPLVADMEKDGCGRVGNGVYNVATIVGDVDMLEVLKTHFPDTFNTLIKYLTELPPMDQGDWYGNSTIFPLRAIKEYFPQAFKYMKENYSGTIPDEEGVGIDFLKS